MSCLACVHGSTNGTNGRPISFKVLPMVPLVIPLVPMVPLVETDGSQYCRQSTVRVFGVSKWYQRYTNIVQGFTNGTNGNTICTNGNANGTIGSLNGTIGANGKPMVPLVSQWYYWLPMVPLVKLPIVPLGEPRTEP